MLLVASVCTSSLRGVAVVVPDILKAVGWTGAEVAGLAKTLLCVSIVRGLVVFILGVK